MYELIFSDVPHTGDDGYVGGPCGLSSTIEWPLDVEQNPLYHLVSIPLQWLCDNRFGEVKMSRWISIFVPYDKENYSHYSQMSSDELDHLDAVVILHDMSGTARGSHPEQESISKNVKRLLVNPDADINNIASYIDGSPTWVQDPIKLENYSWAMSVYGPDLDSSLIENPGILSDGVGYLFLKNTFGVDDFGVVGRFYFQF